MRMHKALWRSGTLGDHTQTQGRAEGQPCAEAQPEERKKAQQATDERFWGGELSSGQEGTFECIRAWRKRVGEQACIVHAIFNNTHSKDLD